MTRQFLALSAALLIAGPAAAQIVNPIHDPAIRADVSTAKQRADDAAQTVTVSVLGAVVAPFTTAAAGVSVQVVAIPTS